MVKVYVVVNWDNSDILGCYIKKSSAVKLLHDNDEMTEADIVEMRLEK